MSLSRPVRLVEVKAISDPSSLVAPIELRLLPSVSRTSLPFSTRKIWLNSLPPISFVVSRTLPSPVYTAEPTGSLSKVICVRAAPGAMTRCNCEVSAKRVAMIIARFASSHPRKAALRLSVYWLSASASSIGIGGNPSATTASGLGR